MTIYGQKIMDSKGQSRRRSVITVLICLIIGISISVVNDYYREQQAAAYVNNFLLTQLGMTASDVSNPDVTPATAAEVKLWQQATANPHLSKITSFSDLQCDAALSLKLFHGVINDGDCKCTLTTEQGKMVMHFKLQKSRHWSITRIYI